VASFYIDNDTPLHIAVLLRGAGHTAVTARSLGLTAAKDDAQLLTAAQRGAVLVTHNAKDFSLLHSAWLRWSDAWGVGAQHAGILLLPQATAAERARGAMGADELAQFILDLVAQGSPTTNELWQWQRGRGWVRRP
jgi:hypothetical protein